MSQTEVLQGLDQASQKHEKEIVIELGSDRILHFFGVYFIILLAIVSKVTELAGKNISCFPIHKETGFGAPFVKYANAYCWESTNTTVQPNSSSIHEFNNSCTALRANNSEEFSSMEFIENPTSIKRFVQWMPYGMLLEAFLFALPSAWWHFRVGARLMGHLKFMQLLLSDIYESVKKIPAGIYRRQPFAKEPGEMYGWNTNDVPTSEKSSAKLRHKRPHMPGAGILRKRRRTADLVVAAEWGLLDPKQFQSYPCPEDAETESWLGQLFCGSVYDRHLFSMLCFENFSSLQHFPFILSVFDLTSFGKDSDSDGMKGHPKAQPLKGAILRYWSNEKNLNGRFLVGSYLFKHVFGTLASVAALVLLILIAQLVRENGWDTQDFLCDILYHENVCVACTIRRKMDAVLFLVLNFGIVSIHLLVSIYQFLKIRFGGIDETARYLEKISDGKSAALWAVFRNEQKKKQEKAEDGEKKDEAK